MEADDSMRFVTNFKYFLYTFFNKSEKNLSGKFTSGFFYILISVGDTFWSFGRRIKVMTPARTPVNKLMELKDS